MLPLQQSPVGSCANIPYRSCSPREHFCTVKSGPWPQWQNSLSPLPVFTLAVLFLSVQQNSKHFNLGFFVCFCISSHMPDPFFTSQPQEVLLVYNFSQWSLSYLSKLSTLQLHWGSWPFLPINVGHLLWGQVTSVHSGEELKFPDQACNGFSLSFLSGPWALLPTSLQKKVETGAEKLGIPAAEPSCSFAFLFLTEGKH